MPKASLCLVQFNRLWVGSLAAIICCNLTFADEITVGDKKYQNVYVSRTGEFYTILVPETGDSIRVYYRRTDIKNVDILSDSKRRNKLRERWESVRALDKPSAGVLGDEVQMPMDWDGTDQVENESGRTGDNVTLKNGKVLAGVQITRESKTEVEIAIFMGDTSPLIIPRKQIVEIKYDEIDATNEETRIAVSNQRNKEERESRELSQEVQSDMRALDEENKLRRENDRRQARLRAQQEASSFYSSSPNLGLSSDDINRYSPINELGAMHTAIGIASGNSKVLGDALDLNNLDARAAALLERKRSGNLTTSDRSEYESIMDGYKKYLD